jgi:hypothetical protein
MKADNGFTLAEALAAPLDIQAREELAVTVVFPVFLVTVVLV